MALMGSMLVSKAYQAFKLGVLKIGIVSGCVYPVHIILESNTFCLHYQENFHQSQSKRMVGSILNEFLNKCESVAYHCMKTTQAVVMDLVVQHVPPTLELLDSSTELC